MRLRSLLPALSLFLLPANAAAAEPAAIEDGKPAYELTLGTDGPVLATEIAFSFAFTLQNETTHLTCIPNCDKSKINVLDRSTAGNYSKGWAAFSDVTEGATILFLPVLLVADQGWKSGLVDTLVVFEAVGGAIGLQVIAGYAVGRPRPSTYSDKAPLDVRTSAAASRSFFSGHVSDPLAGTVATAITYQRLGRPKMAWTVLGLGIVGSGLTGMGRVLAGSHFPTDTIAGAFVGASMGILLPALHATPVKVLASAPGADRMGFSLAGAW